MNVGVVYHTARACDLFFRRVYCFTLTHLFVKKKPPLKNLFLFYLLLHEGGGYRMPGKVVNVIVCAFHQWLMGRGGGGGIFRVYS